MQRLMSLTLTDAEKDYVRMRAREAVCVSENGHECYLGQYFLQTLILETDGASHLYKD